MRFRNLRYIYAALALAATAPAIGQEEDDSAIEELDRSKQVSVPTVEVQGAAELRRALLRISRSPTDSDALFDAGNAALLLGDANAALNFFTRADALQPSNGRIKMGLAIASVRTENPFEALRLFDEAIQRGVPERAVAADRALAFDLLGNFTRAQQDYDIARKSDSSSKLAVQQAVSLALLGKQSDADNMLYPLLQKNDGEAWRARAFLLAARGDFRESVRVTQSFMDPRSAQQFEVYLRQIPQLTGAQKAAAIHLGHFPANNVGRDSPEIQRIASNYPSSPATGEGRLIPSGSPLGPKSDGSNAVKPSRKERGRSAKRPAPVLRVPLAVAQPVDLLSETAKGLPLPIELAKTRIIAAERASATVVAVALPVPPAALPPVITPVQEVQIAAVQSAAPANVTPSSLPKEKVDAGSSTVSVNPPVVQPNAPQISPVVKPLEAVDVTPPQAETSAQNAVVQPADSVPAAANLSLPDTPPAPASVPPIQEAVAVIPKAAAFDLGDIVSAIDIPESEKRRNIVPVDLKKLPSVEAKSADKLSGSKKLEKPAVPNYPARYWVQVATGDALAFRSDLRNFGRKYADLFKGREAWSSAWGKSSRMVIGPFDDLKSAKSWEADFRKSGGNGFVWQSENGVEVIPVKGK
jgi:Flp pilus assembly protein TadD